MPKTSRPTFKKRQKEMARQQKQKDKQARRMERKELKQDQAPGSPDIDPDIAGIRPGPQPRTDDSWPYDGGSDSHDTESEENADD